MKTDSSTHWKLWILTVNLNSLTDNCEKLHFSVGQDMRVKVSDRSFSIERLIISDSFVLLFFNSLSILFLMNHQ